LRAHARSLNTGIYSSASGAPSEQHVAGPQKGMDGKASLLALSRDIEFL
jgi:hypothetical protein